MGRASHSLRQLPPRPLLRPLLLSLLLSLLLFALAACDAPSADYHSGTDGLVVSFMENLPPDTVYEDSLVPMVVRVHNRGAADINYSRIVFSVRGDSFYVDVKNDPVFDQVSAAQQDLTLPGKSEYYPAGEYIDLYPQAQVKPIPGLREQPTTELFASVCYPYTTLFSSLVCVDANAFNGNAQRQACSAETLSFKDQGGPVAVTMVENRPTPARLAEEGGRGYREVVQPVFIIHVANLGSGALLEPPTTRDALLAACGQGTSALPSVAINVTLSGLSLECKPNPVVLRDGEGFTTCTLPASDSVSLQAPNYLATLRADLAYTYRSVETKSLAIIRAPAGVRPSSYTGPERETNPGFIEGETRCSFCSAHPSDPRCSDWPDVPAGAYGCACTQDSCADRRQDAAAGANATPCVYGQTWCPGSAYCCIP